jgi:hypothetical protein
MKTKVKLTVIFIAIFAVGFVIAAETFYNLPIALCSLSILLAPVLIGWKLVDDIQYKEMSHDKKYLSDEAFREKYCK